MDPIAICNLAIADLGSPPITSLEDSAKAARLCKAYFPLMRDAVLEDRDWTFATDRLRIAASAAPVPFGYGSAFDLPGNVIRVVSVEAVGGFGRLDWAKERRRVLTRAGVTAVNVVAIVRVETPDEWSPGFALALAARLAVELCGPITEGRQKKADLWQEYLLKLKGAAVNDALQGSSFEIPTTSLSDRRR